jgi:hypothetical protein
MAEARHAGFPRVSGSDLTRNSERDAVKLRRLLAAAARRLAAVRGPIYSDYETGAEMAQFVLECSRRIEHGSLDVAQLQELWRIFTPAGDWDHVVGDVELGTKSSHSSQIHAKRGEDETSPHRQAASHTEHPRPIGIAGQRQGCDRLAGRLRHRGQRGSGQQGEGRECKEVRPIESEAGENRPDGEATMDGE